MGVGVLSRAGKVVAPLSATRIQLLGESIKGSCDRESEPGICRERKLQTYLRLSKIVLTECQASRNRLLKAMLHFATSTGMALTTAGHPANINPISLGLISSTPSWRFNSKMFGHL